MVVVTSGRGSEGSGKFISSQLGMSITRRKEAFVICTGLMAMCVCVCVWKVELCGNSMNGEEGRMNFKTTTLCS